MVGNSSNRKVARAARTAGGRRRNANTPIGWYSLVAIILIGGVSLVAFSRSQRLDSTSPGNTHPYAPVVDQASENTIKRAGDNWFESYGVYLCDKYAPNIDDSNNPYGISTSNDGVIHISPFQKKYAGHNATVGLFAKAVGLKLTRTSVQVPKDTKVYRTGDKCGDKTGKFVVKVWTDAKNPASGKEIKSNPTSLLLEDKQAVAFAFIPNDKNISDIPLPDSASKLDDISKAATAGSSATTAPDTTATTAPTTATTAPPAATPTTVKQ